MSAISAREKTNKKHQSKSTPKKSNDGRKFNGKKSKEAKSHSRTPHENHELSQLDEAALEQLLFGGRASFSTAEQPKNSMKDIDMEVDEDEEDSGDEEGSIAGGFELDDGSGALDEEFSLEIPQTESGETFYLDMGPTAILSEDDQSEDEKDDTTSDAVTADDVLYRNGKRVAWVDNDDDAVVVSIVDQKRLRKLRKTEEETTLGGREYEQRLRAQFEKIYPRPSWADETATNGADSDSDFEEESTSALLRSSKSLLEKRGRVTLLPPASLGVTRMKNANQQSPSDGIVSSVEFHPNSQLLLTSSRDKTLRLFQVDGKVNPKIQSIHFGDMPIYKAAFIARDGQEGAQILTTGRRKFFYTYDLQAGRVNRVSGIRGREEQRSLEKFSVSPDGSLVGFLGREGHVSVVSTKTWQWVGGVKINGSIKSLSWSADGQRMNSVSHEAEVYTWDIRTYGCVSRFADAGGFKPSCLASSHDDGYLAVGSRSGIVNIYDHAAINREANDNVFLNPGPKPLKSLGNLTTAITHMKFNHDSQIMGMSSLKKKDQFRLVHLPSLTVFQNWPTSQTPLSYVQCFDFSPRGGYCALGNDKGKVLLYRLLHYDNA